MTYQIIYSSQATIPMQVDDLEELLEHSRRRNGENGISGALVYTDGVFLQILEGEGGQVQALMAKIRKDVRHEKVVVLRESEVPSPQFTSWKMAYVSATPEQVADWAGMTAPAANPESPAVVAQNLQRTAQFARDILALLTPDEAVESEDGRSVESQAGVV